jgi:hypothetical protein
MEFELQSWKLELESHAQARKIQLAIAKMLYMLISDSSIHKCVTLYKYPTHWKQILHFVILFQSSIFFMHMYFKYQVILTKLEKLMHPCLKQPSCKFFEFFSSNFRVV